MKTKKPYTSFFLGCCALGTANIMCADNITEWNDQIVALPPLEFYQSQYLQVEKEVDARFAKYFYEKSFSLWLESRSPHEIEEEFINLSACRGQIWFNTELEDIERSWRDDFRPSLEMVREDFVRNPNCIAFEYNKVSPYYNGSLITIDGLKFLSLEGPLERSVRRFFYVILDSNAPLLVRLTPEIEKGVERCAAYWKDRLERSQIAIPRHLGKPKYINYISTDDWEDNSPANVDLLLEMVLKAKKLYDPLKGPLAVHCSGGVGRSGTFIAAFCLISEIDNQVSSGISIENLQISIESLVARLSLQRYHMVARPSQYLNLHQLVEKYCSLLKRRES